jgi:hypothetical protein
LLFLGYGLFLFLNYFEQFLEYILVTWLLSSFEDIKCRYVENIYLDGRLYLYDIETDGYLSYPLGVEMYEPSEQPVC